MWLCPHLSINTAHVSLPIPCTRGNHKFPYPLTSSSCHIDVLPGSSCNFVLAQSSGTSITTWFHSMSMAYHMTPCPLTHLCGNRLEPLDYITSLLPLASGSSPWCHWSPTLPGSPSFTALYLSIIPSAHVACDFIPAMYGSAYFEESNFSCGYFIIKEWKKKQKKKLKTWKIGKKKWIKMKMRKNCRTVLLGCATPRSKSGCEHRGP